MFVYAWLFEWVLKSTMNGGSIGVFIRSG